MTDGFKASGLFYAIAWIAIIIAVILWLSGFFDPEPAREAAAIGRASVFFFIALVFSFFVLIQFGLEAEAAKSG